jgi:hypothetical protein
VIYSGRLPWNPDDGTTARFGLGALPIAMMLLVAVSLHFIRRRWWVAPVFLLGTMAGYVAIDESTQFIHERTEMMEMSEAIRPHVSDQDGLTVAVIGTPTRKFGPVRQWELTARLAADWPPEVRKKFWAVRYGGNPPLTFYVEEASLIFGARGTCTAPKEIDFGTRLIQRKGELDRLLWVERLPNGRISIEPYCRELVEP